MMEQTDIDRLAEALAVKLKPVIVQGVIDEVMPAVEKVVWRSVEIRCNDLDLITVDFRKIIDAFWVISKDYCLQLTKKQLFQALKDYEAMLRRQEKFNPGVDRRLL